MSTLSNESLTPSKPPTQPTNSLQPPTALHEITLQIHQKEDAVARLHSADRTTYKTYLRARTKLASKKCCNLEEEGARKWFNLFQKCADEMVQVAVSITTLLWLSLRGGDELDSELI